MRNSKSEIPISNICFKQFYNFIYIDIEANRIYYTKNACIKIKIIPDENLEKVELLKPLPPKYSKYLY